MKRSVIVSATFAAALLVVVAGGMYALAHRFGAPPELSPKVPVVFEWNDNGVERCEAWYPPPSAYYFPCMEVGERKTLEAFRRHAGPPPREFGFPALTP